MLQLDSDGQCDPSVFHQFWERKAKSSVVYGFRYPREDGIIRFLISRSVSVAILLGMGVWVWDPGVPYRLMHRTTLENILPLIPKDFYLVNILLAALQQKDHGIHWIRTRFRQRFSGSSSINGMAFIRQGWHLMKQVRSLKLIRHPASETREPVNF